MTSEAGRGGGGGVVCMGIACIYYSFALILDMANDELIHSRTPEK